VSLAARRAGYAEWLARAAAGDPATVESALGSAADNIEESGLDVRSHALVGLAALVAAGQPGTRYDQHVATALDHGVTPDEIVGVLIALCPTVGTARVTEAAHAVLGAIGRVAADIPAGHQAKQASGTFRAIPWRRPICPGGRWFCRVGL
jgi:alkylhydroperoxidase/carboxymuconolactone decarboxylase family protein YurZ